MSTTLLSTVPEVSTRTWFSTIASVASVGRPVCVRSRSRELQVARIDQQLGERLRISSASTARPRRRSARRSRSSPAISVFELADAADDAAADRSAAASADRRPRRLGSLDARPRQVAELRRGGRRSTSGSAITVAGRASLGRTGWRLAAGASRRLGSGRSPTGRRLRPGFGQSGRLGLIFTFGESRSRRLQRDCSGLGGRLAAQRGSGSPPARRESLPSRQVPKAAGLAPASRRERARRWRSAGSFSLVARAGRKDRAAAARASRRPAQARHAKAATASFLSLSLSSSNMRRAAFAVFREGLIRNGHSLTHAKQAWETNR